MKQILVTTLGIWIIIVAAMGLTYLPGDASPHDNPRSEPIIRKLNVAAPGERGAGIRFESAGLFKSETSAGVTIQRWWVECLPRDYRRSKKPFHENVSVYLSIANGENRTLTALAVTIQFLSPSGYVLHEETTEAQMNLPGGQSEERIRFWYAENNEFVSNDPYDIVSALVASGSLQLRAFIRNATFLPDAE